MRLSKLAPFLRLACKAHRMVLPSLVGDVLEAVAPEMTAKPGRLLGFHPRAIVGRRDCRKIGGQAAIAIVGY